MYKTVSIHTNPTNELESGEGHFVVWDKKTDVYYYVRNYKDVICPHKWAKPIDRNHLHNFLKNSIDKDWIPGWPDSCEDLLD